MTPAALPTRSAHRARTAAVVLALAATACATPTPPGAPVDAAKATADASAGGTAAPTSPSAATAVATDGVAVPAASATAGGAVGQCRAWTTAPPNTTVYLQPSESAAPFATFGADGGPEAVDIGGVVAQTSDGWYALDPGVAQAGNVGIYRLRWVLAAQAQIAGACGAIPAIDIAPDFDTPPAGGACEVTATADVMVRDQYASDAPEFGPLPAGNAETALARTVDGWLGFDPGVAQAGNIGLYRLRWIAPDAAVTKAGGCDALPLVFDGG